ncbi:MAG: glycosyltransferase [Xanthomonadales bacterium]|nr:glycosyltransferase [Xanthomonadales bacterium]
MRSASATADALDVLIEGQLRRAFAEREAWPTGQATPSPAPAVTIVIPVFNALAQARRCLEAVLAHTHARHRILIVDDASTDPGVGPWLAGLQGAGRPLEVRRNPVNLGYLATVNQQLAGLAGDVVLLNSDTEVTAGWLDALARAACRPGVGIACPVTDQAGPLGVFADVPVSDPASCPARARAAAGPGPLALPVAVGFCMYLRRPMLDAIGLFDTAFAPGYGEENDYSMRAWRSGHAVVASPDAVVLHAGSASFGDDEEIRRRRALHARLVESRWPGHDSRIRDWWRDWPLRPQAIRLAVRPGSGTGPGVLHLIHAIDRLGGTEIHTAALAQALARDFDVSIVAPQDLGGRWGDQIVQRVGGIRLIGLNSAHIRPNQRLHGGGVDLADPGVERRFLRLLEAGDWPLLHVHSLLNWNSLLLPLLARRAGVRVAITLHSLESVCADFTLVPPALGRDCGHRYGGDDPVCEPCVAQRLLRRRGVATPPPAALLASRRHAWKRILQAADAVVAPSRFALERVGRALDLDLCSRGLVIPHGLPARPPVLPGPCGDARFTVGFLGGSSAVKGFGLVTRLAADPSLGHVAFRIHGEVEPERLAGAAQSRLELRGSYRPDQLAGILAPLDLVLLPSQGLETYSLVLSECRAATVPVLASRSGALAERVRDDIDGWLLPPGDFEAWRRQLLNLSGAEGRARLARVREHQRRMTPRTIEDNAADYRSLYRELLTTPAARRAPGGAGIDLASRRLLASPPVAAADACQDLLAVSAAQSPAAVGALLLADEDDISRTDATLRALETVLPGCEPLLLHRGDQSQAGRHALFDQLKASPDRWWLLLEAGDIPLSTLPALLAEAGPDCDLLLPDVALADSSGRRHGIQQATPADRLLSLSGGAGPATACARGRLFGALSAHGLGSPALPYALVLAALRLGRTAIAPGRIGVQRDDRHLSRGQSDTVLAEHRRLANQLRGALDLPGVIVGNGEAPGWRFRPDPAAKRAVAVRLHGGTPAAMATALARLRERMRDTGADCGVLGHDPLPPGCERVVLLHWAAAAPQPAQVARLLAWLELPGVAMVAPRRVDLAGSALPSGWRFDGHRLRAIPAPESASGCDPGAWAPIPRSMPGLDATCLAFRAEGATARDLADLVDADRARGFLAQQRWRSGGHLLWLPEPTLRQAGESPTSAEAPPGVRRVLGAQGLDRGRPPVDHRFRPLRGARACEGPLRVAALTRDHWAPSRYRVDLPLADLHRCGGIAAPAVWRHGLEPLPSLFEVAAVSPNAVLFHDAYDDHALELMLALQRQLPGVRRVVLIDDLITDLPPWHPGRARVDAGLAGRIGRLCAAADLLVVTTPALADAFGASARSCMVIGNGLPDHPWLTLAAGTRPEGRSKARQVRVGWAGAQQHAGDLALLDEIVAARPHLDWRFMGLAPEAARRLGKACAPMVEFDAYPAALAAMELDVALVPLAAHPFNDCKSALKLQEFGALGTAVIASDCPAYRDVPLTRVESRADAWLAALDVLVGDADRRRRDGERLREWVLSQGMARHHRRRWLVALGGDGEVGETVASSP